MTIVDVNVSLGFVAIGVVGILYVFHAVRHAGRDRPHDPVAAQRFIENAARLKEIR